MFSINKFLATVAIVIVALSLLGGAADSLGFSGIGKDIKQMSQKGYSTGKIGKDYKKVGGMGGVVKHATSGR